MSAKTKTVAGVVVAIFILFVAGVYLKSANIPILEPAGPIGQKEKRLIVEAALLSLVVIIPVYAMLIGFAWRYREGNKKAKYNPDLDGSRLLESIWWGVPIILITILAVMAWRGSHDLDPFKSLSSAKPPLNIQVVALEWKWLFIYPEQGVASVNYFKLPVDRPVNFQITSDAPMNSFWIPQLGGQIYAMSGMATQLHLQASKAGDYMGVSANISGEGFADMHFTAAATSQSDFDGWVQSLKKSSNTLGQAAYGQLARPGHDNSVIYYASAQSDLFDRIVNKYEAPVYFAPAEAGL